LKVRDPDRKGKVESGVAHAQKRPLKGKRFESLEEAQAYLDHGEEHWADTRIHGRTKRPVAAMFAEEKPSLQALPIKPFRYYQYGQRTVRLDGCVEVEARLLRCASRLDRSPGRYAMGCDVRATSRSAHSHVLLREHLGQKRGGHRICGADRPRRTLPPYAPAASAGS
jgi:hypothetical protein